MYHNLDKIVDKLETVDWYQSITNQDSQFADTVNTLIDLFIQINNFGTSKSAKYLELESSISDLLVELVELYENRNTIEVDGLKNKLITLTYEWIKNVEKMKISVIIAGVNYLTPRIAKVLESENYQVVAYVDSTNQYTGQQLNDCPVITTEQINNYFFDFLLIIEETPYSYEEYGIPNDKIVYYNTYAINFIENYKRLFDQRYLYSMLYSHLVEAKSNTKYKILVTGLSYAQAGIHCDSFTRETIKICSSSQDLYYDNKLLAEILNTNNKYEYCIIGISYYSFDYDLSLSKSQSALIREVYYPLIKDPHNYEMPMNYSLPQGIESIDQQVPAPDFFAHRKLLEPFLSKYNIKLSPEPQEKLWNSPVEDIPLEWLAIKRVHSHSNLDYPGTVEENVIIFREMLHLLKQNNISPIVVVFPTHREYSSIFNKDKINQFQEIISQVRSEYEFQLLDFFFSDLFCDEDFADADHLNKDGARKMTKYLEQRIAW